MDIIKFIMVYNNDCNNFNMRLYKDVYLYIRYLIFVFFFYGYVKLIDILAGGVGVIGGGGVEFG